MLQYPRNRWGRCLVALGLVASLVWPIIFDQAVLYASQRRTSLLR